MTCRTIEHAPAKLNLALSVGPLDEACGMHPICSWMVTVDFMDDLHISQLEEGSISRYAIDWHADAPVPVEVDWKLTDDLAVQAHLALERYTGRQLPIQLRMEKRIPVGAGLGGGSSDAAAMLRGCNRLFDLNLDEPTLQHIARAIGSDVPFLVSGGSAIVGGFGEKITNVRMPSQVAVLILPEEAPCPTAAVYGHFDALRGEGLLASAVEEAVQGGRLFNDLAEPAMTEVPTLRALAKEVAGIAERDVHVSGSGSTLFVVCDTPLEAGAIAAAIRDRVGVAAIPAKSAAIERGLVESID